MPIFGKAIRVQDRMTLGELLFTRGRLRDLAVTIDVTTLDALAEETWNAPANVHLRRMSPESARSHNPTSDTRISALEVLPDEWIYLPTPETPSPGWEIQRVQVDTDDAERAASLVTSWAEETGAGLPQKSASYKPGSPPSLDGDTLEGYLLNAPFRLHKKATYAYVYVATNVVMNLQVAPTTVAGGGTQNNGVATPEWLLLFWNYLDRIVAATDAHVRHFDALQTILGDAKAVVGLISSVDKYMTILEREHRPSPPPTGWVDRAVQAIGNAYNPDGGLSLDVAAAHASLKSLAGVAKKELVDNPHFAEIEAFKKSLAQVVAFADDKGFLSLYETFDAQRDRYPGTARAMETVCARYVQARALDKDALDVIKPYLDAFLLANKGTNPFTNEVAKIFEGKNAKDYIDHAAGAAALTAGNAPGPMSLWVTLTKLSFLWEISKVVAAPKGRRLHKPKIFRDYLQRLMRASGIPKSMFEAWEAELRTNPAKTPSVTVRAVHARFKAAEEVANKTQAGPRFLGALSILNLWGLYSAIYSRDEDLAKLAAEKDPAKAAALLFDERLDTVNAAVAGVNLTASVTGFIALKADTKMAVRVATLVGKMLLRDGAVSLEKLAAVSTWAGHLAGVGGLVAGTMQLMQGLRDDQWDKILGGSGAIAISIGYLVDVVVTRRLLMLAVRVGIVEIGSLVATEAVLLALGSVITFVGILACVVGLALSHWDEVERIAYQLFAPGTQKFVDTFLEQLAKIHVVQVGPDAVKAAIKASAEASKKAFYVPWRAPPRVDDELRALGFNDEELKFMKSKPVKVGSPVPLH